MARGLPDDSNIVKYAPVYGLHDMAELAARLGSPVNFIRSGDVIMLETFESGFGSWGTVIYSPDGFIRLSSFPTRSGGVSLDLNSGTGVDPDVKLYRGTPLPVSSVIGFGFAFQFDADLVYILMGFTTTQSELHWHYRVKYDHARGKLYCQDNGGDYWEIGAVALRVDERPFHLWKLVVNLLTHDYIRLYLDDASYDLSGYSAQFTPAVGEDEYLESVVQMGGDGVGATNCWIDDAVITQNEF